MNLADELILLLLNEESGYFHQVPGWNLNCAVASAALAELALARRIDTEPDALFLVDSDETGDPALDSILKTIADERTQHDARYWIERLTSHAESIIDSALDRLVERGILVHHPTGRTGSAGPTRNGSSPASGLTRVSTLLLESRPDHPGEWSARPRAHRTGRRAR